MNRSILKDKIKNEIDCNPVFRKGRRRTLVLMGIYLAIRFSDPVIVPILSGIPLEIEFDLVRGLLIALGIFSIALWGGIKLASFFCFLTPIGNTMMMILATKNYGDGFTEMLLTSTIAQYIMFSSIGCTIISIWMLVDKNIAYFGKRRKELQKEYVIELKAQGVQTTSDKSELNLEGTSLPETAPTATPEKLDKIESDKEEIHLEEEYLEQKRLNHLEEEQKKQLRQAEFEKQATMEERLLSEFEGEDSTLRSTHNSKPLSGVNRSGFDVIKYMLCKKYGCEETIIDPLTSVLIFPAGGKILLCLNSKQKKLYMESNTRLYGAQFHKQALEAITYAAKNLGHKFIVTDLSGYANSSDEVALDAYFAVMERKV